MTRAARPAAGQGRRGFALLIVLWSLVLLALMVTHLTATGGSEARIAANLVANAGAEAAADGVVYEAVFRLVDGTAKHWDADGREHRLTLAGGVATVRLESEAGKINPNTAPPELLAALLEVLGAGDQAPRLAAAIADWREPGDTPRPTGAKLARYRAAGLDYGPPGEPFESLGEIGRVLGMTPALLAELRPHLSLYALGYPDPVLADSVVRAALRSLGGGAPVPSVMPPGLTTVTVDATARMASGARFERRATIRLSAAFARGFAVLSWEQPESAADSAAKS